MIGITNENFMQLIKGIGVCEKTHTHTHPHTVCEKVRSAQWANQNIFSVTFFPQVNLQVWGTFSILPEVST